MAVTTKMCSHCNKRIGAGADVCPSCGALLGKVSESGELEKFLGAAGSLLCWLVALVILGSCLLLVLKF